MSTISLGMPKMQVIASLGKWVKYHSRAVFNFFAIQNSAHACGQNHTTDFHAV